MDRSRNHLKSYAEFPIKLPIARSLWESLTSGENGRAGGSVRNSFVLAVVVGALAAAQSAAWAALPPDVATYLHEDPGTCEAVIVQRHINVVHDPAELLKTADAKYDVATCYYERHEYTRAIALFRAAAGRDGSASDEDIDYHLALAYENIGDIHDARNVISAATAFKTSAQTWLDRDVDETQRRLDHEHDDPALARLVAERWDTQRRAEGRAFAEHYHGQMHDIAIWNGIPTHVERYEASGIHEVTWWYGLYREAYTFRNGRLIATFEP